MQAIGRHIRSNAIAYLALFVALGGVAYAGGIKLPKNSVHAKQIAKNAVTKPKIAAGAVDSTKIDAGAVGAAALAPGAVGAGALAPGAVTSTSIAPGAVDSGKIADGSVGAGDLAPGLLPPTGTGNMRVYSSIEPSAVTVSGPTTDATGGSNVTVNVPEGALVMWYASVGISGTAAGSKYAYVNESELGGNFYLMGEKNGATAIPQRFSSYFKLGCSPCQLNTGSFGEWQITRLAPGQHTFSFHYGVNGSGSGEFSDRDLVVAVIS